MDRRRIADHRTRLALRAVITGLSAFIGIALAASPSAAAVTWSPATAASPVFGSQSGVDLATSKNGSTRYLEQVYINDHPDGQEVGDGTGDPKVAFMFQHRTAAGVEVGAPIRLNASDEHALSGSVAASGAHVYVVWRSIANYVASAPSDTRLVRFSSNASNGTGAWTGVKALTTSGRADNPSIAAAGSWVYVSWVDGDSGKVRLQVSDDFGAHFHASAIHFARAGYLLGDRYIGETELAASGSIVAMTWLATSSRAVGWVSRDHATSKTDVALSTHATFNPAVSAAGSRVVFGVVTSSGILARVWISGHLHALATIAPFGPHQTYKGSVGVAVALIGKTGIGFAWSACLLAGCVSSSAPAKGVDILWRESIDNGAHWKATKTLEASTGTTTDQALRRQNIYPSAVAIGSRRFVSWTSEDDPYTQSQVFMRSGTGTP